LILAFADVELDLDLYEQLPREPERAFLVLEAAFREECERAIASMHSDDSPSVHYMHYIAKVLGSGLID
jgi:hypothetical protein